MNNYKQFYLKNKGRLFAYIMRLTADYQLSCDILQESFTRMLSKYGADEKNVALLFKIARNAVIDNARKSVHCSCIDENIHHANDDCDAEEMFIIRDSYRKVLNAIQRLGDVEKDVFVLAVSSDFSYREIAEITGMSETSVRVKIHRARLKLRKQFQSERGAL